MACVVCPFHGTVLQFELLKTKFGYDGALLVELPLFPDDVGTGISNQAIVLSIGKLRGVWV